jgi:hypothetical protein
VRLRTALPGLAVLAALAAPAAAAPTRVAYRVFGEPAVAGGLKACLAKALAGNGYEIVDKLPVAELVLFANRDVNGVNPNGVSIAIAHVSKAEPLFIASKLLPDGPDQTKDGALHDAAVRLLGEEGLLDYLNVAHIESSSPASIDEVCQSVAATFRQKVPANAGK